MNNSHNCEDCKFYKESLAGFRCYSRYKEGGEGVFIPYNNYCDEFEPKDDPRELYIDGFKL